AHPLLELAGERRPGTLRNDEGLRDLAAQLVRRRDDRGLADVRVAQERVLDLDRAHRPARRDDHVVGAALVVEVTLLVHPPAVLHEEPAVLASDGNLAHGAGWESIAAPVHNRRLQSGAGPEERALLH